jgi:lysozyme
MLHLPVTSYVGKVIKMSENKNPYYPYIFTKLALTKLTEFEDNKLEAYWDDIGKVWTIGRGHTGSLSAIGIDHNVQEGFKITEAESLLLCKDDLIDSMDTVYDFCFYGPSPVKLTNNQFSALCIWAYNVGSSSADNSSLADYIYHCICMSKTPEISIVEKKLLEWNKSKGKIIQGLVNRRKKEILLYNTPDDPQDKDGAFTWP